MPKIDYRVFHTGDAWQVVSPSRYRGFFDSQSSALDTAEMLAKIDASINSDVEVTFRDPLGSVYLIWPRP